MTDSINNLDNGGPAFPDPSFVQRGMTLRDYMAAAALTGLCTGHEVSNPETMAQMPDIMSFIAYKMADAMLKARSDG